MIESLKIKTNDAHDELFHYGFLTVTDSGFPSLVVMVTDLHIHFFSSCRVKPALSLRAQLEKTSLPLTDESDHHTPALAEVAHNPSAHQLFLQL